MTNQIFGLKVGRVYVGVGLKTSCEFSGDFHIQVKKAKIRNLYNQVPHLNLDTKPY